MHVMTDEGVEGLCDVPSYTAPMSGGTLEQLRRLVVGEDPLYRELLYQKLHTGTRWVYFHPGWAGTFDNCLWDIVGKAAGLPVHAIMGRVRDSAPAYMNIGGPTKELAAEDAVRAVNAGFPQSKTTSTIRWTKTSGGSRLSGRRLELTSTPCTTRSRSIRLSRRFASATLWRNSTTGGWKSRYPSATSRR